MPINGLEIITAVPVMAVVLIVATGGWPFPALRLGWRGSDGGGNGGGRGWEPPQPRDPGPSDGPHADVETDWDAELRSLLETARRDVAGGDAR